MSCRRPSDFSPFCLLVSLPLVQSVDKVAGLNWMQCLTNIKSNTNATQNLADLLNSNGDPVLNVADATATSYSLCTPLCGKGQDFHVSVFAQDFTSWLLPYLALIAQLPFGAPSVN
jgi:hypothetical protein